MEESKMNRLKVLRKERNLTIRELAEKVKINRSTLSRVELGHQEAKADLLLKLSYFFDVSVDYLLGRCDINERQ